MPRIGLLFAMFSFFALFSTTSCKTITIYNQKYDFESLQMFSSYKANEKEALVAFAIEGDEFVEILEQKKPERLRYRLKSNGIGVFLIPVPVGHTFKIDKISTLSKYAKFSKDTKSLNIETHGIYYYGCVVSNNNRVTLKYNFDQKHKDKLKVYFSEQVKKVPAINFDW